MIEIDRIRFGGARQKQGPKLGARYKIPSVSNPLDGTMGPATALKTKSTWISPPRRPQREAYQVNKYSKPSCKMSQYHCTSIGNLEESAHIMLLSWGGPKRVTPFKFSSECSAGRVHTRCDDCGYPKGAHEPLPSQTPTKLLSTMHKATLRHLLEMYSTAATAPKHRTRT